MIKQSPNTYTWPCEEPIFQAKRLLHLHIINQWLNKGTALTSDQPMIKERHNTYTWPCGEPMLHAKRLLHLYLINQWLKKGSALISNQPMIEERLCTYFRHMRGTNPTCMFENVCTHNWSCRNQSYSHIRMAPSPRLSYPVIDQVPPFLEWHSALNFDHVVTNPIVTLEWLTTYIWHGRNQSSHHDIMAQPLHLPWKEPILSPCQNVS